MRFKVENGKIVEDLNASKASEGEVKEPIVRLKRNDDGTVMFKFDFPNGWNGTLEMTATPTQPAIDEEKNTFVNPADRLAGNFFDPERIAAYGKLNAESPPPGFEEPITFMGDIKPG